MLNFLPGPVDIAPLVQAAMAAPAVWHRSKDFLHLYAQTKEKLLQLAQSRHVCLLQGSGTLANAVITQEIKKLGTRGLIVSNGEFGSRLIQQAAQAGLAFESYILDWGQRLDPDVMTNLLVDKDWLWLTQCETSTGALNLESWLMRHCKDRGIKLCLDSISAMGCMPVDFSDVYMASCASGKGLESYAGIAMVFYNHVPQPVHNGHSYLDLFTYHEVQNPPFTFSSNLLRALHMALHSTYYSAKHARNVHHAANLEQWLAQTGLHTPLAGAQQAEQVWTVALPPNVCASALGQYLEDKGIALHYKNAYLIENNWFQMALMCNHSQHDISTALNTIASALRGHG